MSLNFRETRQTEAAECGLAAVVIASALLGAELSLSDLRRRFAVSPRGLTLMEVMEIASALDMEARALRCDLHELPDLHCPAILHWGTNHFVVLESMRGQSARIIDPARGPRTVRHEEISRKFTGVALELAATPAFRRRREQSPLKVLSLIRWTPSMRGGLVQILVLSVLLQTYMVIGPLYLQIAIDQGALRGDSQLVRALAIGFALFAVFNALADLLRGLAIQKMSALLTWDMSRRLFHHLVRLPLPWFQRRKLADAMTRFDSIQPIQAFVADGFVSVLIDGVLSLTMLVLMFFFAPTLAAVALVAVSLQAIVRLVSLPASLRFGMASLTATIAEQGKRIETLRTMQTIKVMAAEGEREGDWANRLAETVRTRQNSAILGIGVATAQQLIDALAVVAIVYLGVVRVIGSQMTVGVLYAFLAYRSQFAQAAAKLFERAVNWRMLDMYTHRLADIVLSPVEAGIGRSAAGMPQIRGTLEMRNVSFSYAPHEPMILRNISFRIESGEFVAIAGPSGSGKSTLLKLLIGLYLPTGGEVLLDGVPLSTWGPSPIRRALGVVMQDDELLAGTVADNVAFFDEQIDIDRVWNALGMAAIDTEVRAMPMRADTLIGDLGSTFSGGQKQRILLARAFYRSPRILLLDEATSHVDLARECAINAALVDLEMTRIVIAHRPESVAAADRVIVVQDGVVLADRRRPPRPSVTPPEQETL